MNHNLQFKIIPTSNQTPEAVKAYLGAYETYNQVWSQTFKELFGQDYKLFSNDFTRQDFIQTLHLNGQCVALDLIKEVDLTNSIDRDDSWLKSWKAEDLDKLIWQGHRKVLVNSYFTVHPDYRRSFGDAQINVGYIMGCLSVLHQLELGNSAMLGMMRNNRSMNTLGKMLGSSLIAENIIHNSLPSDLVVFIDKNVQTAASQFPTLVNEIYKNKTDFNQRGINERAA